MSVFYEVWDDTTGNRLGEFETPGEARAILWAVLRESGSDAASNRAVPSYSKAGSGDEYEVATVLEGADFVDKATRHPTRATS